MAPINIRQYMIYVSPQSLVNMSFLKFLQIPIPNYLKHVFPLVKYLQVIL